MSILVILAISVFFIVIEVPPLMKKKMTKEIWFFSVLLSMADILGIAVTLHMKVPNPLDWIAIVYKPYSDFLSNLF